MENRSGNFLVRKFTKEHGQSDVGEVVDRHDDLQLVIRILIVDQLVAVRDLGVVTAQF